jgi:hypothetical protein
LCGYGKLYKKQVEMAEFIFGPKMALGARKYGKTGYLCDSQERVDDSDEMGDDNIGNEGTVAGYGDSDRDRAMFREVSGE